MFYKIKCLIGAYNIPKNGEFMGFGIADLGFRRCPVIRHAKSKIY